MAVDILVIGDSISEGHPNYRGPEDGGPIGNVEGQPVVHLVEELGDSSLTFYNAGIPSTGTHELVDGRLHTWLDTHTPTYVYMHAGVNDLQHYTLSAYLSELDTILALCVSHSAELIVDQILPFVVYPGGEHTYSETIELWNASLESWCFTNNIKLTMCYQQFCELDVANEDHLESTYDYADFVHLSVAGSTRLGQLQAHAAIPMKKRTWGNSLYPDMPYESWNYWILSAGATIEDDSDTGTLSLLEDDTADSEVLCLPAGSKNIIITPTILTEDVIIKYRSSANNFYRDAVTAWTTYTGSFALTNQFLQVRLENQSVLETTVSEVVLSWGSALSTSYKGTIGYYLSATPMIPDYNYTLVIKPQRVLLEEVEKNQVLNNKDGGTSKPIDLNPGGFPNIAVTLQLDYIENTEAMDLVDLFLDTAKANGIMKTFLWTNYAEASAVRQTYVVRFAEPKLARSIFRTGKLYGIVNIRLLVLGRTA